MMEAAAESSGETSTWMSEDVLEPVSSPAVSLIVSVVLVLKTAKRITSNSSVTATKKGGGMQGVQPKGHHP